MHSSIHIHHATYQCWLQSDAALHTHQPHSIVHQRADECNFELPFGPVSPRHPMRHLQSSVLVELRTLDMQAQLQHQLLTHASSCITRNGLAWWGPLSPLPRRSSGACLPVLVTTDTHVVR